jgi:putative DNA primase/helicase
VVELIRRLIGPGLVYSGRVDQLEGQRFALGHLFGKLLYLDDDMKSGIKLPDGVLKKISEAKTLTGEYKNRPLFDFRNTAIPILLCNNVPSLSDLSHGMMRRLKVVPFNRIFKEKEIDRHLFERIGAKELPGVLNRALEGWKRLQCQGHFTKSVDILAANKLFLAHANPLQGFIDECCEKESKSKTKMDVFYNHYKNWASENGFTMTQTQPTVRKNLEHLGFSVPRHGVGRVIKGLSAR